MQFQRGFLKLQKKKFGQKAKDRKTEREGRKFSKEHFGKKFQKIARARSSSHLLSFFVKTASYCLV